MSTKIRDIIENQKTEKAPTGYMPYIEIGDIDTATNEYLIKEKGAVPGAVLASKGEILVSTVRPTRGAITTVKEERPAVSSAFAILKPNHEFCDPRYLFYCLRSKPFLQHLGTNSKGATYPTCSKDDVLNYEFDVVSLQKQRDIVAKLDALSKIISKRQYELSVFDELIKARFVEMFGDPDTNPMGWTERPLSEMLNVLGGYAFKSEGFSEVDGIPVLRIGNVNAGFFKPVNMVFWAEDESLDRYIMYPGDLVMSLTGTVGKDDYGNVCILGNDYDKYYLNQRNAKLELKEGLDKYYMSQLLRFEKIKKRLTGISRGVRQANISNKDILNLSVPIPPSDFQLQYAAFVAQVDKSKAVAQKALDEAQLLFDSLMQKYFG